MSNLRSIVKGHNFGEDVSFSLADLVGDDFTTERPKSLAAQVADKLRKLILLEQLPPGLAINERELSDLLGTSRTPVRDGIRILEVEGLVDYSSTRRPRVANPSMETVTHWLSIQATLEGLAGQQACSEATDDELAAIEDFQRQMIEAAQDEDMFRKFELDMAFHKAIVAAAHNPPLVETHDQYNSRLWRARYVSSQRRANRDQQMAKHQGIVDALLARNAEAASKALTAHLQNAIVNIKASIAERA